MSSRSARSAQDGPVDVGIFVCPGVATISTFDDGGHAVMNRTLHVSGSPRDVLSTITGRTKSLVGSQPIRRAGVAVAAELDSNGVVVGGGELRHWRNLNLPRIFGEQLDTPLVVVDNDAVALAHAFLDKNARFSGKNVIQVRIGAGFGACAARWDSGLRAHVIANLELGHNRVQRPDGITERTPCSCGGYDHVESFSGGRRIDKLIGRAHMLSDTTWSTIIDPAVSAIRGAANGSTKHVVLGGPVFIRHPSLFMRFNAALQGSGLTITRASSEVAPANAGYALLRRALVAA